VAVEHPHPVLLESQQPRPHEQIEKGVADIGEHQRMEPGGVGGGEAGLRRAVCPYLAEGLRRQQLILVKLHVSSTLLPGANPR
jgi:hypothetical protein